MEPSCYLVRLSLSSRAPLSSATFWSLAVEEQIYVFLPILFVFVCFAFVRGKNNLRKLRAAKIFIGILVVSGFAFAVWEVATSPNLAYYSTINRLWEFSFGGIISLTVISLSRFRATALALVGLALIVVPLALYSQKTVFPGFAALVPVLGTVLILIGGEKSATTLLARFSPIQFLGNISYGIYLWHWPILVIGQITIAPMNWGYQVALMLLSVLLAYLSYRYIENPFRYSKHLLGSPRKPLVVTIACMSAMAILASGTFIARERSLKSYTAAVERSNEELSNFNSDPKAFSKDPERCIGAQALDPGRTCRTTGFANTAILPDPAVAESALQLGAAEGCFPFEYDYGSQLYRCSLGPKSGYSAHILVAGDSHSNMYFDAYRIIAVQNNWRIDVTGYLACSWVPPERVLSIRSGPFAPGCVQWATALKQHLATTKYDMVVTTLAEDLAPYKPADLVSKRISAVTEAWTEYVKKGNRIAVIADVPRPVAGVVACVDAHRANPNEACGFPKLPSYGLSAILPAAAAEVPQVDFIDLGKFYCPDSVCPVVVGGVLVYADNNHITSTYAKTLAPYLGAALEQALTKVK